MTYNLLPSSDQSARSHHHHRVHHLHLLRHQEGGGEDHHRDGHRGEQQHRDDHRPGGADTQPARLETGSGWKHYCLHLIPTELESPVVLTMTIRLYPDVMQSRTICF